ncbi:MAG TPA: SDR family oxidoreductase [Methylomirabilota bacterium]|nr:SDR family oxidoreductase [Methylomirabilota bacterium]
MTTRRVRRVLITGAGRGLGLAFTRRCLERGDEVFATCREPSRARDLDTLAEDYPDQLTVVALDVADAASIRAAHAAIRRRTRALDLLINNAGVYSRRGSADPTERLGTLRFDDALHVLRTNAVAPLMVTQQCLDLLEAGRGPRVVAISSEYGSVSENTDGFPYYYAASKAALNMMMRSLAADLRRRGIVAAILDPGWVRTDMGGRAAPLTPARSVAGMMRVIDGLTLRDSGRFYTWDGKPAPW